MSLYTHNKKLSSPTKPLSKGFSDEFAVVEHILRDRQQFFTEIGQGKGLYSKIAAMTISSIIFLAIYGAILGSTHSLLQALTSATKLPLVFLATSVICLPTLYIFSLLFGFQQRLNQTVALLMATVTVMAVLLLSLAPITFFFMLTTSGYQFFKLLNVLFFMATGAVGLYVLRQGRQILISIIEDNTIKQRDWFFYVWMGLYIFIGCQMAWTLRPFVGYPHAPFELVRELGGNFFVDIVASMGELFGFWVVL